MRLIDYKEIRKLFDEEYKKTAQLIRNGQTHLDNLAEGFSEADEVIWKLPDVDAVEVVHGKWKINRDDFDCEYMQCSCCKEELYPAFEDTVDTLFNYCPNCGAKMDGERNG